MTASSQMNMEPGVSLELARVRSATLSEIRYRFSLDIPRDNDQPINAIAEISFLWGDAKGRAVVLDLKDADHRVHRLEVNGAQVEPRFESDHLAIPAAALAPQAVNRLRLEMTVGDEAMNRNDGFLYTLFVPDRAHFSLPLFDQPDLKARVTWELTIPADWLAIANAPLQERTMAAGKGAVANEPRHRLTFLESDPLPTYLFAFAAGEFETVSAQRNGRTLEMLHRETDHQKVERNIPAIFDLHFDALDWLESYTGIEYPFQSFGFVLIPSFQYGGMEHPGAITYRATSLLLEENATEAQLLNRASLIAHETAHMWFGDLVTMAWFDDVWTKEVFANFMAAKIVHPSFPQVDHDLRFLLAHHPRAYAVDRTRGANPIRQPLENLREAGTLYGPIIYQKAPVVMQQLETLVGEDAFRRGMRDYLERYAFGNAAWTDLVRILDGLHESDLRAWSATWVEQAGRPTVAVERSVPGGAVVVRQTDPWRQDRVWPQRLQLALFSSTAARAGEPSGSIDIDLQSPAVQIDVVQDESAGDILFLIPNAGGTEYGLFRPDPPSLQFLVSDGLHLAAAVLRGTAWLTIWDAMLEGWLEPSSVLGAGIGRMAEEPAEQLLSRMLADLSEAYWRFLSEQERMTWAEPLEDAIWSALVDSETVTRRSALFSAYLGVASTDRALARLARLWRDEEQPPGMSLSEEDRIGTARVLALHQVPSWREIMEAQAAAIENPDRLAEFRFLMPSLDADPEVRRAFFDSLREPANRRQEPWVLQGLENLHHPLRATSAVPLVLPALEMLEEIQRTGDIFFPAGWVAATLGGHNSPRVAAAVADFLGNRPDYPPRLAEKILQASDMVERAARVIHGESG